MTSFVALYCGESICEAKMIAVSGDFAIVSQVAEALIKKISPASEEDDTVISPDAFGQTLRLISLEADHARPKN